jgi:hypothetical protein
MCRRVLEMHQAGELQVARSMDDPTHDLPFDCIKGMGAYLRVDNAEAFRHDLLRRQRSGRRGVVRLAWLHTAQPIFKAPSPLGRGRGVKVAALPATAWAEGAHA